ncbi:hypothetical protein P8629_01805 [Hydrogenovibrio sp. 3SP14C1]|uniref:hypothetical protein n=1 Tax=Hydrogenovibrio sp. 3SP14C1 TaxID=3038774 RepID=UPI002417CCD3|nr:hypothetical protein [Hydrogenovibrio sp. 3SP14C1]MDG4811732.1 hypothetical protein [Hydrogenovibrio sp. 3SP14C1]
MSSIAKSQVVIAEDWIGLLTAYCLNQSGQSCTLFWVPNLKKRPETLLLEGLKPWQDLATPEAKQVQGLEFLLSQLDVVTEKKGLLSLDIASAAELEAAEQWVLSDRTQESDLQVMDEKVWVNIEPRLMSGAKSAIWRPDAAEVSCEAFEQSMLDLLSQQGVDICLLENPPTAIQENQRISLLRSSCGKEWLVESMVLTSVQLVQCVLPESHPIQTTETLVSFFRVHPGFLRHLVQVNGLLLMPQKNGSLSVRRKQSSELEVEVIEEENQLWDALQDVYPEMAMFEPLESVRLPENNVIEHSSLFSNLSFVSAGYEVGMLQAFHQIMRFAQQFEKQD